MPQTGETARAQSHEVRRHLGKLTFDHNCRLTAADPDVDCCARGLECTSGAGGDEVDVDSTVVHDQDRHCELIGPRQPGEHLAYLAGVGRTVRAHHHVANAAAVARDQERCGRMEQQPVSGAAEMQRLQQTWTSRADHEQVTIPRERDSGIGLSGQHGDLTELGLGERCPRLGRVPWVQLRILSRDRGPGDVWHHGGDDLEPPARPAMIVHEQPSDVRRR